MTYDFTMQLKIQNQIPSKNPPHWEETENHIAISTSFYIS